MLGLRAAVTLPAFDNTSGKPSKQFTKGWLEYVHVID